MPENDYHSIQMLLTSTNPDDLHQGLERVREEIARHGTDEARPLFEMVSAIFYIDPLDRPDLAPILNEAISLVVGFGPWVIPVLIESLDAGDLKAQMAIAHALGRMGADAIEPLIDAYHRAAEPAQKSFFLYALGKINSPRIIRAVPLALEAAKSADLELRDTATRTLGKLAEAIPAEDLSPELRRQFLERLRANLADTNAGIRAKTVRSLGKLARYNHLPPSEKADIKALCRLILGTDGNYDWDRAYIVRREAEEALNFL